MAKLIMCTESELDKLMNMSSIRNSNPWIYSIDLDHNVKIKEECRFVTYERTQELLKKYGDIVIDCSLFNISDSDLRRYFSDKYQHGFMEGHRLKCLHDTVVRQFTSTAEPHLYSFASLLYEILESDRTALFVLNNNQFDEQIDETQFLSLKSVFEKNILSPMAIYTYQDYLDYGESICIDDNYNLRKKLIAYIIEHPQSNSSRLNDLMYSCFPTNLLPNEVGNLNAEYIVSICIELGYQFDSPQKSQGRRPGVENLTKASMEEKLKCIEILRRHVAQRWFTILKTKDIDLMSMVELKLWLLRLGRGINTTIDKKRAKKALKEYMVEFDKYIQGRSRKALEEFTNPQLLEKIRKENMDVTSPYDNRKQCIDDILIYYGEIDRNYVLPSKDYLAAMTKAELWNIFKLYYFDITKHEDSQENFENFPKKTIIKLLQECELDRQSNKVINEVYKDDLLNLNKNEIVEFFISNFNNPSINKTIKDIIKTSESTKIAIDRICANYGIKYKFEKLGKDVKTDDELHDMSKEDLITFGRLQYELLLDNSQKKSSIIKLIIEAQKEYKKELDRKNSTTEFSRKNLMKLTKKDLLIISKAIPGLREALKYESSKSKMVDKLLMAYFDDKELSKGKENPFKFRELNKLEKYLKERNKKFMKENSLGMIMTDEYDLAKGVEVMNIPEEAPDYIETKTSELEAINIQDVLRDAKEALKKIEESSEALQQINHKFGMTIEDVLDEPESTEEVVVEEKFEEEPVKEPNIKTDETGTRILADEEEQQKPYGPGNPKRKRRYTEEHCGYEGFREENYRPGADGRRTLYSITYFVNNYKEGAVGVKKFGGFLFNNGYTAAEELRQNHSKFNKNDRRDQRRNKDRNNNHRHHEGRDNRNGNRQQSDIGAAIRKIYDEN